MRDRAACSLGEIAGDARRRIDPVELSAKRAAAGRLGAAARTRTMVARLGPKPEGPLCSSCTRRTPKPGRKCCASCIARSTARSQRLRAERRAEGLCLCGEPLAEGHTNCEGCLEDARRRLARSRGRAA
jgi:hypothetical protein